MPAHPRVGGENVADVRVARSAEGSSPRGRGKPKASNHDRTNNRLIPAWAGKTGSSELSVGDRVLSGGCG